MISLSFLGFERLITESYMLYQAPCVHLGSTIRLNAISRFSSIFRQEFTQDRENASGQCHGWYAHI